jgi:hypothetical protein
VSQFLSFTRRVIAGDDTAVADQLEIHPTLATIGYGNKSPSVFYKDIAHYMYGGDTALHLAAAACRHAVVKLLLDAGAGVRARNRRGAEPLHYAADANRGDPGSQSATISLLIAGGADPNAIDKSGVAPIHRAVRTRSIEAVRALVDGGANLNQKNRAGSTPLFLARHNTGKSGSGSARAREQREAIEAFLIERGAKLK